MTEDEYRAANPGKLRIYDVEDDLFRDATQADIDNFMALKRAYGRIRYEASKAHEELMADLSNG